MELLLIAAVLPLFAACYIALRRLNAERDEGTPWGDAFLRAFTGGIRAFGKALVAELILAAGALFIAWVVGAIR